MIRRPGFLEKLRRSGSLAGGAARLLEQAVAAGTQGYPRDVRRRLRVLNVVTYLIIIFTVVYVIQHSLLDFAMYRPVIAINLGLIGIALLVPLAHRIHETAGGILLAGAELAALFAFSAYLGWPAGMQLQYFVFAAAPFVVFGIRRPWLSFTVVLLGLIFHLISWFYYPRFQALIIVDKDTLNALYVTATVTTVGLISAAPETAGGILLAGAELAALFAFSAYLGWPAGMQLQYFVFAAAPFVVFGIRRPWLSFTVVLLGLIFHLISWFYYPRFQALIIVDKDTLNALYVTATVTTVGLISAAVYYAYSLADSAQAQVDALLRNILPESVAERLTDDPSAQIADRFEEASVLFVDLVGFTPLAQRLGPSRTVRMLNRVITDLDALAIVHGVEKIKTIGDAYMAVSGVPIPVPDHLDRLACMALKINDTVRHSLRQEGLDAEVRIGMASGPVMAGVIGTHKFSYDVWGSTVNRAARMESHGAPGKIQVSDEIRRALRDRFTFERAPDREIKGIGHIKSWYLTGERDGKAA